MSPAVWFITGASSGMGRAMTEVVLENGDIAVATLRKPEVLSELAARYPKDRLLTVKLDVTQPSDIAAAFETARAAFGRIDIVFNNAGYAILGEIESVPDDVARKLFETNFWGAMGVAREAVRFFREVNTPQGGHLISITSMLSVATSGALGYYTASKHAVEAGLECLAKEMDPKWNIKITNVLPGGFATRGSQPESLVQTELHPAYKEQATVKHLRAYIPNAPLPGDTHKAMRAIYHQIAQNPNPPVRVPLGKDAIIGFRAVAKGMVDDADKNEALSADLLIEGKELMTHLDKQ